MNGGPYKLPHHTLKQFVRNFDFECVKIQEFSIMLDTVPECIREHSGVGEADF
jgi:hypothetical protein